jgi:hypothetical protein
MSNSDLDDAMEGLEDLEMSDINASSSDSESSESSGSDCADIEPGEVNSDLIIGGRRKAFLEANRIIALLARSESR